MQYPDPNVEKLARVPAHLEDIVFTYGLDYSNAEQATIAERIDTAADWTEAAFDYMTRARALDWLWNNGDFIEKLTIVEHQMAQ